MKIRSAIPRDLPRIHGVRNGTLENRLTDPSRVKQAEIDWYMREAVFLVAEDEAGMVQGFCCANSQTGYIWALFVIEDQQGKGFGTALIDEALLHLVRAGHAQAFLTTDDGTRAADFYRRRDWREMGTDQRGELVFVKRLT